MSCMGSCLLIPSCEEPGVLENSILVCGQPMWGQLVQWAVILKCTADTVFHLWRKKCLFQVFFKRQWSRARWTWKFCPVPVTAIYQKFRLQLVGSVWLNHLWLKFIVTHCCPFRDLHDPRDGEEGGLAEEDRGRIRARRAQGGNSVERGERRTERNVPVGLLDRQKREGIRGGWKGKEDWERGRGWRDRLRRVQQERGGRKMGR